MEEGHVSACLSAVLQHKRQRLNKRKQKKKPDISSQEMRGKKGLHEREEEQDQTSADDGRQQKQVSPATLRSQTII